MLDFREIDLRGALPMKLPLKITITATFALFTTITILVVASLNYLGNREFILARAKTSIATAAESAERGVNHLVGQALTTADTISSLPAPMYDWRQPEPLLITLAVSLKKSPEIYGVFVGFSDGAFVQAVNLMAPDGRRRIVPGTPAAAVTAWRVIGPMVDPRGRPEQWRYFDGAGNEVANVSKTVPKLSTYDPRSRPWFKKSQKAQGTIISNVYVFESLKKPGVTVSRIVRKRPDLSVGVDLSLFDLAGLMARLSPGERGVVAVTDDTGGVVAHPEPWQVVKSSKNDAVEIVSVSEIADERIRLATDGMSTNEQFHKSFSINDKEFLAYFRPSAKAGVANWNVISIAAISDFTGGLLAALQHSIVVAGFVLALAVCAVAVMAGWIAGPILRLRKMADQITQLNFSEIENFSSPFEEIRRLQDSMDRMKGALDTFLRFVPRDVVRELVADGRTASVGGTNREVTLMFTDIENFTTITERMRPEDIMSQVSEYFEHLSFAIQVNQGTIDKYIGDAIMAIWNAPAEDPEHVNNACRGALAAFHISEELNSKFVARGLSRLRTRFGLHSGEVLVGNVGSHDRMQYTCLGSCVNLAARIEGLNKFYGTQILASDAVRRRASPNFLFRRVDIVEAKGTTVRLIIYELMGERGEESTFYVNPHTIERASKYEQAFDFYLHRDFKDALNILDRLTAEDPSDPVVSRLSRICREFVAEPPPPSWNGATSLDEK